MSPIGRRSFLVALAAALPLACGGDEGRRPSAADLVDDLDQRLLDVERVALVAGLPGDACALPSETEAALEALAERLGSEGFRPLMRRGARPRPRVEVVLRLSPGETGDAPTRARAAGADLVLFLCLDRLEVLAFEPPEGTRAGRVDSIASGTVRLTRLGGDALDARTDFESRTHALLTADETPPGLDRRTAVARRVGRGLLDTLRLGAAWVRVPSPRGG